MKYVIDNEDTIIETDLEWDRFAEENDAAHVCSEHIIGTSIWDHVSGDSTRHLYRHLFKQVRALSSMISIPFRCDSPSRKRLLRLIVQPGDSQSLRLTSLTESIETRKPVSLLDQSQIDSDEIVILCGWCKKIKLSEENWIEPEIAIDQLGMFVDATPRLSHGMCPHCADDFKRAFHVQFGPES